jgi:hypothetical protein
LMQCNSGESGKVAWPDLGKSMLLNKIMLDKVGAKRYK